MQYLRLMKIVVGVEMWSAINKLTLNASKTASMILDTARYVYQIFLSNVPLILIGGNTVPYMKLVVYLGFTISCTLVTGAPFLTRRTSSPVPGFWRRWEILTRCVVFLVYSGALFVIVYSGCQTISVQARSFFDLLSNPDHDWAIRPSRNPSPNYDAKHPLYTQDKKSVLCSAL